MATQGAKQRLTELVLENWCNFTHVEVELQQRAFLVGPNAAGKSNFLDALRFLRDVVSIGGGFQEAVRKREGVSALRCLAARQNPDIRLQVVEEIKQKIKYNGYPIESNLYKAVEKLIADRVLA